MLRLTRMSREAERTTIKVEGWVVGEGVEVLQEECMAVLQKESRLNLDLDDVTRIDARGVAMLDRLVEAGRVTLDGSRSPVRELLDGGSSR